MRIIWIIPAFLCLLAGLFCVIVSGCCTAVARTADRCEEACRGGVFECLWRGWP
jgi:hypothetical protein